MTKIRLEQFSDGVFAIVVTLLAIELHPVQVTGLESLLQVLPSLMLFVLSFLTVAVFWINHNHLSHHIEVVKNPLLWTNTIFLLFVTLLPFSTGLMGENPSNNIALAIYAGLFFCSSLAFHFLRRFVHKQNKTKLHISSLTGPFCYAVAAIVALINPLFAYIIFFIPPIYYLFPHKPQHQSIKKHVGHK